MKTLKIISNDIVLFDGEVNEVSFTDGEAGVKVEGRYKRAGGSGSGFLDLLTAAQKRQTNSIVAQRKESLNAEKSAFRNDEEEEVQVQT